MLEGLPFPDNSCDFTHQRLVIVALPTDQWVRQLQELLRVARPGGWVEVVEGDLLPGGPGLQTLNALGESLSQRGGCPSRTPAGSRTTCRRRERVEWSGGW